MLKAVQSTSRAGCSSRTRSAGRQTRPGRRQSRGPCVSGPRLAAEPRPIDVVSLVLGGNGSRAPRVGLGGLLVFFGATRPCCDSPGDSIAVVVKLEAVSGAESQPAVREGSVLGAGAFCLAAGTATLSLVDGVRSSSRGRPTSTCGWPRRSLPARQAAGPRAQRRRGLHDHERRTSRSWTWGTELGFNVDNEGTASLLVFEGKAAVSVLNPAGDSPEQPRKWRPARPS